jgi:pimeloyl-ACP methyl ester carboxylesterase
MTPPLHRLAERAPDAPTTLFVHGLEDAWQSWNPLAAELSGRRRLFAAEMPWAAGSDYRWRRADTPGGFVAAAIDALGAPIELLVGHSFGASAILECLAARPECARAAVLVSPFQRVPGIPLTWKAFDTSQRGFFHQMRDGLRARLHPRASKMKPEIFEAVLAKAMDRIGPAAFLCAFEQFAASDEFALERATLPVLVVAGSDDPSLSAEQAASLVARLPRASLLRRDDYDHFCHVRRAPELAAQLEAFLAHAGAPEWVEDSR